MGYNIAATHLFLIIIHHLSQVFLKFYILYYIYQIIFAELVFIQSLCQDNKRLDFKKHNLMS